MISFSSIPQNPLPISPAQLCVSTRVLAFMTKHFQVPIEITKKEIQVHIKTYESNFSI